MKKQNQRTTKKQNTKELIENIIAKLIYNTIICAVVTSAFILIMATLGAVVDLCMNNKTICICFFIVSGYYIIKETIREINR